MTTADAITSPFAPAAPSATATDGVLTLTDAARRKLIELRDTEPEGSDLGVRVEILSEDGADFTYDLSFQIITKAGYTDQVRNHDGLRTIVPAKDLGNLEGAVLDYEPDGLVLRNPNKPRPIQIGNLVINDDLSMQIKAIVDNDVNPSLAAHGGFVTFIGHDGEGRAFLTMGGGCHGCSMSRLTMMDGVSVMIKEAVPAITKVVDATDHSTGENPYA